MRISDWSSDVCSSDLGGVIGNADRLGMAGIAAAYLLVGRIGEGAARIAALDAFDPRQRLEHSLGAPEAASGENGGVSGHHGILCGRGGRDAEIGMRRPYSKGGGVAISGGSSGRPAASAARIAAISSSIERTRRSEEHTSEIQSLM